MLTAAFCIAVFILGWQRQRRYAASFAAASNHPTDQLLTIESEPSEECIEDNPYDCLFDDDDGAD